MGVLEAQHGTLFHEEEEEEDRSGEKGYTGVFSYMKIKLSPRQLWGEEREKAFLQK